MKTYRINYYYDGYGYAEVTAKNKAEAEEKYHSGDATYHDNGDNYSIEDIDTLTEVK